MVDIVNVGLKVDSRDIKTGTKELDRLGKQAGKTQTATGRLADSIKKLGASLRSAVVSGTKKFASGLQNLGEKINESRKSINRYGKLIASVFAGILIKKIIDNTIAQEQAIAQLDAALVSTHGAVGLTSKELQKMAREMQAVSTYGDEVVMGMQSILLTFTKVGKETFPRASQAIVDLSARMGMDLKSAALQVGKALNDPATGLSMLTRAGIQFTDAQKEVIKGLADTGHMAEAQALILEELETQFGGSALAARNTMGGALTALKNAFGDLLEADSGVPGATNAINDLTKLLGSEDVKKAFAALTGGIIKAVEWSVKAIKAFADFGEAIGVFFAKLATGTLYETEKEVKSLTQQIGEQEAVVRSGADALALSMSQYEEITKHIEAMEKISGVLPSTLEMLRKKQEDAAATAKMHSDALAEEKKRLDDLRSAAGASTETPISGGILGDPAEGAHRAAIERRMQEEEELLDWELDRAIEAQEEMEEALEEKRLEQELNRAIHDEEELERIYEQNQRKLEAQMEYYDRLYDLETGSQQAALDFVNSVRMMDLQGAIKHGAAMLSNVAKQSKAMFNIHKAFSLAQAVVSLPSAVIQSFENGGGYPWGLIPAGLMLAEGLGQIKKISSASFGGGASVSGSISGGGGGASIPSPVASAQAPTALPEDREVKHTASIVVSGGLHSDEDVRNLVSRINDVQEDMGGQVSFVTS